MARYGGHPGAAFTTNVTGMGMMFAGALTFNQDISGWDVGQVWSHDGFDSDTPAWGSGKRPTFSM